jgi:mRNA-degrading endonuclease RelE of RelBE toxin-antitoxin system
VSARQLVWQPSALKDLRRIGREHGERIIRAVRRFAQHGEGDVKYLRGFAEYRLRVGNYRVRFTADATTVTVLRVLHRRDAYRR